MNSETIFVIHADPRSAPRALPVFPNPKLRPEGKESPLCLSFRSEVPRGIDVALGRIPKRDTAAYVQAIGKASDRSIRMEIDDCGGDALSALPIAVALLQHPFRVTAHVAGRCSSAAVYIALAADKRTIDHHAGSVLVHRAARICIQSQFDAMRRLPAAEKDAISESLSVTDDMTASLLTSRLGVTEETARAWMLDDRKWSAAEALELGFVDDVINEIGAA